jgi:inward rectifier potassium channel
MTMPERPGAPAPPSPSRPASSAPAPSPPPATPRRSVQLAPRASNRPRIRAIGQRFAPHEDAYHYVLTRSWTEFFLLMGLAFLGANALFATLYWAAPGSVSNARPGSFEDAFFFSVQTMATIGYGGMTPVTRYAHVVVTIEAMTGILSVALITGITFAKFARPTARVLFSDNVILAPRDGVPHLMFRVANWRHNLVAEAQLRVIVLVTETTREGETLRRQIELPLVRDRTPLFALTWTVMHLVDAQSPFFGPDALARLRALNAEIFVTLTGLDEAMGQIHAQHSYRLDDIVANVRFADVLTLHADGTRELDYRRFQELVPLAPEHRLAIGPASGKIAPP